MRTTKKWGSGLVRGTFWAVMGTGLWMMLSASASYLELGDSHPFFLEKLPLARPRWWLTALWVHVPSALFALPACLLLLVGRVRRRFPRFHRWLGRVTGGLLIFVVVPSGMYLAFFAQGGLVTTLGFWLTGMIALLALVKSIVSARRGDFRAHRRFSSHVVAQLSVAVFSRFLLVGAESIGVYREWVYVAALYVPIVACAVVAELLTGPRPWSIAKGDRHEELVGVRPLHVVR